MIKRLAKCVREYKKQALITPLFMIGEVSCECVIPLITKNLINSIQTGCDMNEVIKDGTLLVLLALVSLSFGALAGKTCATASAGFAKNTISFIRSRIILSPTSTVSARLHS